MKHGCQGAALILVLWLIVLLAGVVGAFAFTARVEQQQSVVGVHQMQGGEWAQAGLEYALFQVISGAGNTDWVPDGRTQAWQWGPTPMVIRIQSESGKIDLNHADAGLLTALLVQVGAEETLARRIAGAIVDWRDSDDWEQPDGGAERGRYQGTGIVEGPANQPFQSIEELRRVLGMTPALYTALRPSLTIWSHRTQPDASLASETVLRSMGVDPTPVIAQRQAKVPDGVHPLALGIHAGSTFSVESHAVLGDGRTAWLHAVVRMLPAQSAGSAYHVVQWQQGMGRQ